jgi:hypothetical protein
LEIENVVLNKILLFVFMASIDEDKSYQVAIMVSLYSLRSNMPLSQKIKIKTRPLPRGRIS